MRKTATTKGQRDRSSVRRILVGRIVWILLACLTLHHQGVSQQRKAGLTGAAFLKVGVGARAVGMGSAVTALSGDVNQMFWNPAGIAHHNARLDASFNINKWIADLGHNAAAVSCTLEEIGTIGIGFISFGLSGIPADRDIAIDPALLPYQVDMNSSATYDYRDIAVQASYAREVTDRLSLGITAKLISQSLDRETAQAVAFDFGSIYHIGILDWRVAARFSNLGSEMKYYDIAFSLPLLFSVGTALTPVELENNRLTIALDAVKIQDGPQYVFSGMEYTFMDRLSVRGGWKFNYSGTDDGGTSTRAAVNTTLEGFSLGTGIMTPIDDVIVGIDYSFTRMQLLSSVHRISLQVTLK